MDLALVTIGAGLLSAGPWLAAKHSWARRLWDDWQRYAAFPGFALIAYAAYHLLTYTGAIVEAFGYVPMLAFACTLGLVVDLVIGARFALPAVQTFLIRRAKPDSPSEQLAETIEATLGSLRRREALLSCGALLFGLLSLLSLISVS